MIRGLWESYLRTDYELITKGKVGPNGKNLTQFDAIVFANSTGEMDLTDDQKKDLLSFVHDDGKGFVGIHAALDSNYKWPEYGEMIGGWFDEHPWSTFDAPIILEDPSFPATRHFPQAFVKRDEIYQAKAWSRDKVNVLLRLDETKLNYEQSARHAPITTSRSPGRKCTARGACSIRHWATPTKVGTIPISRRCTSRQSSGFWA